MEGLRRPDLPNELLVRIEDAGLNASAPTQQRWLDGWLLSSRRARPSGRAASRHWHPGAGR